jgi:hypothetical protein
VGVVVAVDAKPLRNSYGGAGKDPKGMRVVGFPGSKLAVSVCGQQYTKAYSKHIIESGKNGE